MDHKLLSIILGPLYDMLGFIFHLKSTKSLMTHKILVKYIVIYFDKDMWNINFNYNL